MPRLTVFSSGTGAGVKSDTAAGGAGAAGGGSAGVYGLREELLKRVQVAAAAAKVNDVLFREMLIQ